MAPSPSQELKQEIFGLVGLDKVKESMRTVNSRWFVQRKPAIEAAENGGLQLRKWWVKHQKWWYFTSEKYCPQCGHRSNVLTNFVGPLITQEPCGLAWDSCSMIFCVSGCSLPPKNASEWIKTHQHLSPTTYFVGFFTSMTSIHRYPPGDSHPQVATIFEGNPGEVTQISHFWRTLLDLVEFAKAWSSQSLGGFWSGDPQGFH